MRQARGQVGAVDWAGSFEPRVVNDASWKEVQARIHAAYDELVDLATSTTTWDARSATGMAAFLAHTAYHLGAIRQVVKRARVDA